MLILFDIDGTLLLSKGASIACARAAGAEVTGRPFSAEGLRTGGGLDPLIWRMLCEHNGVAEAVPREPEFRATYARHLGARLAVPGTAYALPGVFELLAALEERAATPSARGASPATATAPLGLGLLTGNYPETGALKLRAAGIDPGRFAIGAWGDDGGHRRELLPVALSRFRDATGRAVPPAQVVIVGDTPHDIDVARAHGARSLGVATGGYDAGELRAVGADLVVDDLSPTARVLEFLAA